MIGLGGVPRRRARHLRRPRSASRIRHRSDTGNVHDRPGYGVGTRNRYTDQRHRPQRRPPVEGRGPRRAAKAAFPAPAATAKRRRAARIRTAGRARDPRRPRRPLQRPDPPVGATARPHPALHRFRPGQRRRPGQQGRHCWHGERAIDRWRFARTRRRQRACLSCRNSAPSAPSSTARPQGYSAHDPQLRRAFASARLHHRARAAARARRRRRQRLGRQRAAGRSACGRCRSTSTKAPG